MHRSSSSRLGEISVLTVGARTSKLTEWVPELRIRVGEIRFDSRSAKGRVEGPICASFLR